MGLNRRDLLKLSAALPFVGVAKAAVPSRLTIASRVLDIKGKAATVFGIVGPDGKPGLSMVYGDAFDIELHNSLKDTTAIHWHGLTPPVLLDGVPMLAGAALKPDEVRHYQFANRRVGTHWMHSHLGLQEQRLLAAPLIVHETAKPVFADQEHVVMLHDFTFREPAEILAELKAGGGGHAEHMKMDGMKMEGMAMGGDVAFDALLANDRTLDDPEILVVEKSGAVRLRLINAASATNLWVDLGALTGLLIAVDGNAIRPIAVSRFPLAIAQRADVRITLPTQSGAWPILFQSEGSALRGGMVLRAGDGVVAKLSDQGEPGLAIGLEFEAKLRVLYDVKKAKVSQRETVMLTGGEKGYQWGFDGRPMMHDVLFRVKQGRRVQLTMQNMTAMVHPMHLHGHYFQVTAINGVGFEGAVRDTILIPPGAKVSVEFDADNPGTWAFHCHHLYHMNSGMMAAMAYV